MLIDSHWRQVWQQNPIILSFNLQTKHRLLRKSLVAVFFFLISKTLTKGSIIGFSIKFFSSLSIWIICMYNSVMPIYNLICQFRSPYTYISIHTCVEDVWKMLIISGGQLSHHWCCLWIEYRLLACREMHIQWNLSVTTTSVIKFITCDLFRNVF